MLPAPARADGIRRSRDGRSGAGRGRRWLPGARLVLGRAEVGVEGLLPGAVRYRHLADRRVDLRRPRCRPFFRPQPFFPPENGLADHLELAGVLGGWNAEAVQDWRRRWSGRRRLLLARAGRHSEYVAGPGSSTLWVGVLDLLRQVDPVTDNSFLLFEAVGPGDAGVLVGPDRGGPDPRRSRGRRRRPFPCGRR